MPSKKYLRIENEKVSDAEEVLPLCRKLCFAIGGAPYQITSTVIGFFLNIFLLEVALLKPRYVSAILFAGKAWDAITDPTIGILVQRTNTRWGKMRPWIIFSAPFACGSYLLLFYVPWEIATDDSGKEYVNVNEGAKFGFYFAMFCTFMGLLSCLHVPYTALTMYVTTRQRDRDIITFIRMGFETTGILIAVIVQGLFVGDKRCKGDEKPVNSTSVEAQKEAYFHGSLVVIGIYMICCITVFLGSKEKKGIVEDNKEDHVGFFSGIKLVFTYKPYLWASLTFLFVTIAVQIVQGNIALYCTHVLKEGEEFSKLILVLLIVSIVSMPVWQIIAGRFGKKKAYAAGIIILIPVFASQMYFPERVLWIFYLTMVFAGLGIAVALLLPWSVLPDVLDLYMLQTNTRHDALFYSFYVFFNKLAAGLALAASQMALDFGGYVTGECSQPDSVSQTLKLLMTPGPVIMLLCALITLYFYPIDEAKRKWIKQQITEKSLIVAEKDVVYETSKSYDSMNPLSSTEM